jgi:3-phenylpropionate/trans-cinnamate dioxygenase ferredoxin reductase subunit
LPGCGLVAADGLRRRADHRRRGSVSAVSAAAAQQELSPGDGDARINPAASAAILSIDRLRRAGRVARGRHRTPAPPAAPGKWHSDLVLATGARARLYPGLPHETGRIHYLRTLEDAAALSSVLAHARRLAIVGAGYVGMEVAASARQLGIEVAVYEAAPGVMQRSIGAATSDVIEAFHRQHGVRLHLNTSIERIEADRSGALAIHVTDAAAPFAADALVIGIGAEPNVDLAALAGIDCGRAIRVDADCRTSDSAIFAIGDCTEQAHPLYGAGLRLESVQNAIDQAKCAAAAIAGKPAPPVGVPWFWSDQYQHRLQVAGLAHGHDQSVVRIAHDRAAGSVSQSVWYLRQQRVIAVEALDAPQDFMVGRTLIRHGTAVTAARLADAALPLQAEATTGKGT